MQITTLYIYHWSLHAINRKNNALHCTAMICDMYVLEWNIIHLVVLYVCSNLGCTNRRKIGRGCLLRSALPWFQSVPLVSGTLLSHHPSLKLMEAVSSQCYQLIVHPAHPCLDPFGKYLHRQLHPLWQSSGKYSASKVCHLTPPLKTYGEGSSLSFSCQHGPVECEVCNKDLKRRGYAPMTGCLLFCVSWIKSGVIVA